MAAQLEALELQGYKTFANRTLFKFSDRITVIVGPNGSGKSNIADSIRWVLGEQSYRLLRGKKTEDMIFSGSEQRARSGMASVTITFDNSDGWLPIDFNEVAITRRAYRDGQNEYLINGQRMRLMDVNELLAKSGLAERTYTIIGQGLVDEALALRADERRPLFEEAAGIGLYKSRKEEALRRLETTQRNIERVRDIMLELQPRLKSLERQAKRAQEFSRIRTDLQFVMREWYGYHWHRVQQELAGAMEILREREANLEHAKSEQFDRNEHLTEIRNGLVSIRTELNGMHRKSAELHTRKEAISRELAVIDERFSSYNNQIQNLKLETSKQLAEVSHHRDRWTSAMQEIDKFRQDYTESQACLSENIQLLAEIKEKYQQIEQSFQESRAVISELTRREAELTVRLAEKEAQLDRDKKAKHQSEEIAIEIENSYKNSKQSLGQAEKEMQEATAEYKQVEDLYKQHLNEGSGIETEIIEKGKQVESLESQMARIQAQIDLIDQAEINLSGYSKGTQLLLQASRTKRLGGILGALSNYIEVQEKFEVAVAAALGEFIDAVLIDSEPDLVLDLLSDQFSRGVILPIQRIQSNRIEDFSEWIDNVNVLGVASQFVRVNSKYQDTINLLLSNSLIVADRKTAKELDLSSLLIGASNLITPLLRIVTLNGEVFYPGGPIATIGSGEQTDRQTILGRTRRKGELVNKRREVQEEIIETNDAIIKLKQKLEHHAEEKKQLEQQMVELSNAYDKAKILLDDVRLQERQLHQRFAWTGERSKELERQIEVTNHEIGVVLEELSLVKDQLYNRKAILDKQRHDMMNLPVDEHESQVYHWRTVNAVTQQAFENAERRAKDLALIYEQAESAIVSQQKRIAELESDLLNLEEQRSEKRLYGTELDEEIVEIMAMINPLERKLNDLERDQISVQSADVQTRQSLTSAEHQYAQARITLATKQEALDSLRRRIEDDLGLVEFDYADQITGPTPLPFDGIVKHLPSVDKLDPELENTINRQRSLLRRLGPVNPEAQQEFEEINTRYTFLSEQIEDLEKAEVDVRKVITELDGIMERELLDTFNKVSVEFEKIFTRLFDGGSAHLLLTDPQDITNSGIEIEARLPGRRLQGLSLLSGGERSLTATALIFAILRVSPTPFCLLDEVDAMLDEANLVRFREMLEELSDQTQFVIVTHNRNTVQAAEIIYGVTMGRDSVSQVVSLKPDAVVKEFIE